MKTVLVLGMLLLATTLVVPLASASEPICRIQPPYYWSVEGCADKVWAAGDNGATYVFCIVFGC